MLLRMGQFDTDAKLGGCGMFFAFERLTHQGLTLGGKLHDPLLKRGVGEARLRTSGRRSEDLACELDHRETAALLQNGVTHFPDAFRATVQPLLHCSWAFDCRV